MGRFPGAGWVGAVALIMVLASAAHADKPFPEPEGFGKATFGMTEAQLQAAYPKAKKVRGGATPAPGQPVAPFTLAFYDLDDQRVGSLQHCHVEFRFFQEELYEIQFRCPDKEQVTKYLKKRFGPPTQMQQSQFLWVGTSASVTHISSGGVFAFGDMQRTREQTTALMSFLAEVQAASATASAAPAAPTPPPPGS